MYDIHHDLVINVAHSKVFEAISLPEHLTNWWPLKCSGKPQALAIYNFYFGPEHDWQGIICSYQPQSSFHINMTQSDPDWDHTTLGFDLKKKNAGTLLSFSHKGWQNCNSHFRTTSFCWAILLKGLKEYCEKGVVIPFEERS